MIPTILSSLQVISYSRKQPSPTTSALEFLEVWRLMGLPSIPSPFHLPPALQKLCQPFIFSVAILFSTFLLILFFLFYLNWRASNPSAAATSPTTRRRSNQAASTPLPCRVNLKEELRAKLPIIMFDEVVRSRDSQCCVCLGEFELKEQLHQIPSCNHLFHINCIHHWLQTDTTCPLCRGSVVLAITETETYPSEAAQPPASTPMNLLEPPRMDAEADHRPNDLQVQLSPVSTIANNIGTAYLHQDSVVVHISTIHASS